MFILNGIWKEALYVFQVLSAIKDLNPALSCFELFLVFGIYSPVNPTRLPSSLPAKIIFIIAHLKLSQAVSCPFFSGLSQHSAYHIVYVDTSPINPRVLLYIFVTLSVWHVVGCQ